MTTQTITAFFDTRSDATKAVNHLVDAGIARANIRLMPETGPSSESATFESSHEANRSAYDATRDEKGFWASLGDMFFPNEDRYTYAKAMSRGSIMVSATVDEKDAGRAKAILEEDGTVNIDERESSWRKAGWPGYQDTSSTREAATGNQSIPIVEEQIKVGKRQVSGGSVKVRSYVVETPISEKISLRSESVNVERRPADRAAAIGEDAFRERTIEVRATSEEAVVSKTARVTGEVVVTKDSKTRTETVQDKVRRTEVDVEDDSGKVIDDKRKTG